MKRRAWRHGIAGATALVMLAGASLVAATAGAAAGSPSAPRAVHASGTATSIHLKWLKPASTGASPVREYVVTSKPLGRSCTTKKTSCVVKRLKPDSSYTFKVVAKNSNGASVPSVSNQVKVAKVSVYFRAELAAFDKASTAAESALAGARTEVEGQKALNRLTGSFGSFISALTLEHWPSKTVADMTSFVADTHELLTNTVRSLELDVFECGGGLRITPERHDQRRTGRSRRVHRSRFHLADQSADHHRARCGGPQFDPDGP